MEPNIKYNIKIITKYKYNKYKTYVDKIYIKIRISKYIQGVKEFQIALQCYYVNINVSV